LEIPFSRERLSYAFYSVFLYMMPLTVGVGLLLCFLYFGRPDSMNSFLPYFGEGQVMQFVVIIAIAGNIWSLAIVGVVGRTEVAAIYGGIIGYVLGKRSSDSALGAGPTAGAGAGPAVDAEASPAAGAEGPAAGGGAGPAAGAGPRA
jgi:hypothetical protein